ncbi:MAG: PARP-type zinc finger-containing protein [Vicinamibacterales bacterium]
MPHLIEPATTGRARCRGCGSAIVKGELRVGEAVPNLYADADGAETTHWYHPRCAAYRRPEAFLAAVAATPTPDVEASLIAAATLGVAHHRLPRLARAERAASARAACRACRTPIAKGHWRLALLFWQDGRSCPPASFMRRAPAAIWARRPSSIGCASSRRRLSDADAAEVARALASRPADDEERAANLGRDA